MRRFRVRGFSYGREVCSDNVSGTCGTGCGLNLVVKDGKAVGVSPWHRSPVNDGKLCPKGNFAYEFIHSEDRLTKPLVRKGDKLAEASWDEAYNLIAKTLKKFKPEEVACLASARVSNEENYLMQKFARTVLRTPNVDHCSRLFDVPTVVGLSDAFGTAAMTQSIADIAQAKSILIIGSNTFEGHPLVGRRLVQAKKNGAKIICADPRFTPTAKLADLYLPLASGTDVALLNGIMQQILKNNWEKKEFIAKRTRDFEKMKAVVMKPEYSLENVSKVTGIPAKDFAIAAEWIAKSESNSVVYSLGVTQHTTGVDNVKSVANLQMLTGNVGRPGPASAPSAARTTPRAPATWARSRTYTRATSRSPPRKAESGWPMPGAGRSPKGRRGSPPRNW